MFTTIVLLTLTLIVFLTFCDWIRSPRLSTRSIKKSLKGISQAISLGEWIRAERDLQPILESGKGGGEAILYQLQVLRGTNRLEEAFALASKAARDFPEDLLFRLEEGNILLQMKRPKEALDAFRVCSPILRGETEYFRLGLAFYQAGNPLQCLEALDSWLPTTQNGEITALAADALFEQKRFKEAIELYTRSLNLGYQTHQVFTQLGSSFRRLGNLSESERVFRSLLEQDPKDVCATLGLGACMQERGHYQKALLIYQSGDVWETKDPRLMKEAGICALRTQKFNFAERYFLEVMKREEPSTSILAYYGYSLEGQRKWQEAEQTYLRLIQLFPSFPHGFRALAWLFGVGLSTTLTTAQGLHFAHAALKLKNDLVSLEILSACEARAGHFAKAYQIQELLCNNDQDPKARLRRQQALRKLRNNIPLDDHHVSHSHVA